MQKKPFTVYLLIILLFYQVIGAVYGGVILILYPSGEFFKMPIEMLANSPFGNYLIPGIILLLFLGVFPAIIAFILIKQSSWRWGQKLNIYKDKYFGWTFSIYFSIMLILWIQFEVIFIGYGSFLQAFYYFYGAILLIITLLPQNVNYYSKQMIED